jgi:hypothetical protein
MQLGRGFDLDAVMGRLISLCLYPEKDWTGRHVLQARYVRRALSASRRL